MNCFSKVFLLAAILFLSIRSGWSQMRFRKCGNDLGYCTSVRNRCRAIAPPTECGPNEKCCKR
uniref:Uncharacterized protein n=2 Tax=Drosophila melanogaster TaxID=7227 RepID=A0A0B4KEX7_DROME|nr:uncharacterized protein Dmel_CG43788 [Drosophila melanogaster]AGB93568.1 uncharacterized protein Dmel_CG43788 [Drosophila melanogaster]|eukprot:NP_001261036.1 uncharacterized protein Dmel_CG43788 [Drosophila melanogaster]